MADLSTEWKAYIVALKTASPAALDVTTLVAKHLATVRAAAAAGAQRDDANTMYMAYLTIDT